MKKILNDWGFVVLSGVAGIVVSISIARCGSSNSGSTVTYTQIERLARPAINEGLVITNAYLNAFNAIAPSVDLTAAAAPVVAQAAQVLEALFAGVCLTNLEMGTALTPGRVACPSGLAVADTAGQHNGLLNSNAIGLDSTFLTTAGTYATTMAGLFLPDVMRIDTTVTSGYNASLCNSGKAGSPALCGGRTPVDPVMDITYAFLLNGELAPSTYSALRNGTNQTNPNADNTCTSLGGSGHSCGDNTNNPAQGHKASATTGMPWSPAPW